MYSKIISFIEENGLLYQAQCGFRKSHSTQHAILDIINTIQTNMDKRLFSCGIFIDLKKAFDTVNYGILLNKLEHYVFRGIINDWFPSYLTLSLPRVTLEILLWLTPEILLRLTLGDFTRQMGTPWRLKG